MSEQAQEQMEQGGGAASNTAVKALAAAAATGAATYAIRKALASRNGHSEGDEGESDETPTRREDPEDSAETGDEEYEDTDESREDEDDSDGDDYEAEASAEDEEADGPEESKSNGSARSRAQGLLRQPIDSGMLGSVAQLLVPLAEEAAGSAGRYVGEHAPDPVREHLMPAFIKAFEQAK